MLFNMLKPQARITESSELAKVMGVGAMTSAGVTVTSDSAMKVSAVYACVMVIAESLAQLPLILYQRDGDKKTRAASNRLYSLLHDAPNDFQTSFDWRLTITVHILLHGAGYSFINRSVNGEILELLPMQPDKIKIKQNKDFSLDYTFTDSTGAHIPLRQDQVFRVTGFSDDGINGISPIERHRQTIGIASAADNHTALTFKNGAKHSGILQNSGHFSSDDVAKRVKESWDEASSGSNSHKTALLEDGLTWVANSMTNRDAQYIEIRKFQIEDIARIFRVPPHKIGHLEKSTNNNIEQQALEFVTDTLMPWIKRWEQSISRDLIGRTASRIFFAEILVDGLLRGDSTARAAFYQSAVGVPWMTVNEARTAENRNPIAGGDVLVTPLNMTGVNQ
jgi:HK97 family phage portal protein